MILAPLCEQCGELMEVELEEVMGVLFRCPNCGHEISRPFTGPGSQSFAPDTPLAQEEEYG